MIDFSKLKEMRGNKTQRDVADGIGISQNHYSQIENGLRSASLDVAKRIASFFGVKIDEILLENPLLPSTHQR